MVTQLVGRALLAGAALLGASAAPAQPAADADALSAVLACADLEREILRLECYDEAVAAIRSRAESARGTARDRASTASAPDAASGRTDAREPPAAIDPPAAAENDEPASARAGNDGLRTSPPPDVTIDVEAGARRSPAAASRSDDAGDDDRDADDDDRERQVTVVDVRTAIPGRAVFVTSDGEEFVQTSGRLRLYLPDVPFVANVRSGAVGGMFLTPEGTRRSIRISARN